MSDLSAKRQTLRKAGTQSHGTHAVSRATERRGSIMDQRNSAAEPHEVRPQVIPLGRWAAIAARLEASVMVPAQRDALAA